MSAVFRQTIITIVLFGLTACSVPLQHFPSVVSKLALPVAFVMPYGLMFSNMISGIHSSYPDSGNIKALYTRGLVATPWYTYKMIHYGLTTTLYRYRIMSYVTRYHNGYGVHVRVPIEKQSQNTWIYVGRDKNIEKRAWQDLINYINMSNSSAPRLWSRKKYTYNPGIQ